ncbi:MAG: alpha/beta hydrolase [Acidimicrobiia bacterium]|nr:alpha/beta hydrolase [Acidimicrobiia bacterium]
MIEDRGKGHRTVLLLHGAGSSRLMWIPQLERLSDEFRVVAIDLPGHGSRRDEAFTVEASVGAAAGWVSSSGAGPVLAVGLSAGGYVALALADQQPDLVAGMVLSGSSAAYTGWGGLSTRLYGVAVGLIGKRIGAKMDSSLRDVVGEPLASQILAEPGSPKAAGQALRNIPGRDYRGMAARFQGPVLVLNGERDSVNRDEQDDLLAVLQDGRLQIVDDGGHACSMTRPDAFSNAVRTFAHHAVWPGA